MEVITIDLCTLLYPPQESRVDLLYFLEKSNMEIVCYSALPRENTRAALKKLGLMRYLDDIIYTDPPESLISHPGATVKSCIPKSRWPAFMRLFT